MYLALNGMPFENLPKDDQLYLSFDPQGAWRFGEVDRLDEIEKYCVQIHGLWAAKVFGDIDSYFEALSTSPKFMYTAGLNSEFNGQKSDFEKLLKIVSRKIDTNRLLFLYDARKLVSSIQECTKELVYTIGEFYRVLNLENFFYPLIDEPDGLRYVTSPVTTKIHASLNFIFIRLYSLMDYHAKLAFEIQNLPKGYQSYNKLKSMSFQYGDKLKLKLDGAKGTIFEKTELIKIIETLRNHIVHDGLLDDMPKVYKVVSNNEDIERFVLLPDIGSTGRLETYKNRKLFYGNNTKINEILPEMLFDFQNRQVYTLKKIAEEMS